MLNHMYTATLLAKKVIVEEMDIVLIRQLVKEHAIKLRYRITEQTKLITAASEISRNTLIYGGGGEMALFLLEANLKKGLKLVFKDEGPGIADIEQALQSGFSSGTGMGLGLGGAKRLVSEFDIVSEVGKGTSVTLISWTI